MTKDTGSPPLGSARVVRQVSPIRHFLAAWFDHNGEFSECQIAQLYNVGAARMRRLAAMAQPRLPPATIEAVVDEAFADLWVQLRLRRVARLRHSPVRAARWMYLRMWRLLEHAREVQVRAAPLVGAPSVLTLIDDDAPHDDRAFARDIADLPDVDRYCLLWPASGLAQRDYAATLGLDLRTFVRRRVRAMQALGDPTCEIDAAGLIRRVNGAALRLLGVGDPTALLHRPVHDALHGCTPRDEHTCPIHETLWFGTVHHVTSDRFATVSGTRDVEYICRPIRRRWAWLAAMVTRATRAVAGEALAHDPSVIGAVITFHDRIAWRARSTRSWFWPWIRRHPTPAAADTAGSAGTAHLCARIR